MRLAVVLLACAVLVLCGRAYADTPYKVDIVIAGGAPKSLAGQISGASQLVSLQDHAPASPEALRRRAEDDLPNLDAALKALGYWKASLADTVDSAKSPAQVTVTVTPGALFHLAAVRFLLRSGAPAPLVTRAGPSAVGLDLGGPALSAPVAAANERIVAFYADNGRAFAKVTDRHVTVDVATARMTATYTIDPGPAVRFGATAITGLKRVDRDYVTRRIAWHAGAAYDQRLVTSTTEDLVKSGLFSGVTISHAASPAPDGTVAMTVALDEALPHSIGAGVGYNTNIGFGASTFWEDRNLFGHAEDLRLDAGAAQKQTGLSATFRRPDLFITKQDFLSDAELLNERTDAYTSRRMRIYGGLEELMFPPYTLGAGISLERAYLTDTSTDQNENYLLVGEPLYLRCDTTDDLLNPTRGTRLSFATTPYQSISGRSLDFISSRIQDNYYRRIGDSGRYVVAVYGALGSIEGATLAQVPVDKRLYAGGAGSVRGYAYQEAGPLNSAGAPIGGRSSLEAGAEFRWRFTETLGIVPFYDVGNVYPTNLPDRLALFQSVGIGLRYFTVVGPLRLDLAFPLEKRPSDAPLQVYISIGQSF